MASVCRVMAEKRIPFILILPRLLLILIEVIILIEPKILVWPMAVLAIILGFFFLMIANFIHGWVNRREAHMVDPKWQPQNGGWIYFLSDARFWPRALVDGVLTAG